MQRYSPTEGAAPPPGAIVLFDGRDTSRLKDARISTDGFLEVGFETVQTVKSFFLHAEFRTPYMPAARGQGRSNSGFYLQRRYEVQVLDSFGLESQFNDCASMYRFKAPDLNMCFPPLRWQTYDIEFREPKFDAEGKKIVKGRITVRHNGVVVQNNVDLENKTGGGKQEGPDPLPILFQDHKNGVNFRNIWMIPREESCPCPSPCFGTSDCTHVAGCPSNTTGCTQTAMQLDSSPSGTQHITTTRKRRHR